MSTLRVFGSAAIRSRAIRWRILAAASWILASSSFAQAPAPESQGLEFLRLAGKSPDSLAPKAGGPTERIEVQSTNDHIDYVVKVYELKSANAAEIYPLILNAVTLEGGFVDRISSGSSVEIRQKAGVYYRYSGESYLVVTAPEWMIAYLDQAIAKLDVEGLETAAYGNGYFYYRPKHRRPTELIEMVSASAASGTELFVPDDSRNVIYFDDLPSYVGSILEAIEYFDRPADEVECLIRIYEIDGNTADDVGLDWQAFKSSIDDGDLTFVWGDDGDTNLNIESLTASLSFTPALATQFLNYLAARGHAEVITDTRMRVVNGRTATLESVTQIPYLIRNQIDGFPLDAPQTDVPRSIDGDGWVKEFEEGVTIEITPTIGTETIEFEVAATVASHLGYTPNQSIPIIAHSTVTSALDLEIGKPACMTGLVRTMKLKERAGIPLLKDIPYLGLLFSREVERTKRSHLCVCITPMLREMPIGPEFIPQVPPAWPEGQTPPGEPWPQGRPAGSTPDAGK